MEELIDILRLEKSVRDDYENTLLRLEKEKIIERIWNKDYTIWSDKPDEISNRLGWLQSAEASMKELKSIEKFVEGIKNHGIKNVLLMGMGGSSLAPEVFSKTFGNKHGYPELEILDSTDPGAVLEYASKFDPSETLYIVSTKSGGTVETFSFMKYFYYKAIEKIGGKNAGNHFIAITDPGSGLETVAKELKFKKIFLNDPNIGGRYSALSLFGIVPAALIGIDIKKLLSRHSLQTSAIFTTIHSSELINTSARVGVIIGELAKHGRDKLTFIISDKINHFGDWIEQLVAESTGKNGKGILPVQGEALLSVNDYANDRLFVNLKLKDDSKHEDKINELKQAGHPVIQIILNDIYDLGAEFFRWELATAIAGWSLNIQPFNQPDVEAAKILARKMVDKYKSIGKLTQEKSILEEEGIIIYGDTKGNSVKEIFNNFLNNFKNGDKEGKGRSYISLQAYLKPDKNTSEALQSFRTKFQKKYKAASTSGYGPRFLHSTGQLHKGDAGNGLFIQFTADMPQDIYIPDEATGSKSSMTFGVLKTAQAMGDRQALINKNRKVIRIDLGNNIEGNIKLLEGTI
jgi:glucose-6-phosphate isomerase